MKKFNLFNEIIVVNKSSLITAINSNKIFAINIEGEILYEPFIKTEILIYKNKAKIVEDFTKVLGNNYQLIEDRERVLIKAFSNWQEIINININNSSYDDTTADGVAEFSSKELEDIGWQVTDFNMRYRELVELLEKKCDGTLICIEQEEPYQFSGLGFISDNNQAKEIMFNYCKTYVEEKLKNDEDFKIDELDDDQIEAVEFFKINI